MQARTLVAASMTGVLAAAQAAAQAPAGAPEQAIAPATAQEFSNRVYIGTSLGAAFLPKLQISD